MSGTPAVFEFPVSFAQQRLWFLEQLESVGAAYTIRLPVRLRGPLDAQLLQQAVNRLVARHEALRTTIHARHGEPVQVIAEHLALPVAMIDMAGAAEAAVRARVTALSQHAFDLDSGPLLRVMLMRVAADDHVLLILLHHAIADAWSSGILFRDLAAIYAALVAGREAVLPELTLQYADYASWQRDWLAGGELARQADFWREHLRGAPPLLALPTDYPRPALQTFHGSRWTHILPRELTAELRRLSVAEGCTLFMTLLAGFDVLLHRYTGEDDIIVGTPVAGRRRSELEPLIGLFASTLVMRCDLGGQPTFRELLARVKRAALAAWAHQDLPFEKLVEALQPARSLSHSPVFQVMFILQNAPWEAAEIPGLQVSPAETDAPDSAKFDLTLSATEYEGKIWLAFEYNTDLFETATVTRLAGQFETLLRAALADPGTRIGELALAEPAQMQRLLQAWNATAVPLARDAGVHRLIESRVQVAPGATAIECGEARWSYAELDDWADALADRLRALGAGSGAIVGICLERSPEMVGAVLAVLKSGAAWLPLDPGFPPARLQFMVADSAAGWLVTSRRLAAHFPHGACRVLCVEDLAPAACAGSGPAAAVVAADQLAYLIYTSGSTGQPKGVRVTHGAVVNFLTSMLREPGLAATDRLLAVTTLSFDIAVLELLGPLCAGGTVVIAATAEARDGAALARRLAAARISVMQATPATWRALLASGWRGQAGLRVLCGGEALDGDLAGQLLGGCGELWNLYGPTETTIWSTCARIVDPHDISVGRPVANTRLYVLDEGQRPTPPGVPGELCIGGAGVSPGYHARDALTAERFIPDPFAVPGSPTLYRTGDRARFLADGRVQLLGRMDSQVKLRGFRIETGEVEATLAQLPGVSACAVALREATPGDPRLVAWVVPPPGVPTGSAPLRDALRAQLPDYMVPAAFVFLEALPLTPNGKVDRRALPAPDWAATPAGYAAPRNAVEEALCALFAEVLGAGASVGIHDDFFERGGHSLLATRLVARIRNVFEVELALRALFEAPTPAALAGHLSDSRARSTAPRCAVITRRAAAEAPLSFTQRRLWFMEQLEPGNAAYNLHAAFTLRGDLDRVALGRALNVVIGRHEALRTTFAVTDGEPRQRIAPALHLELAEMARHGVAIAALDAELVELAEQPFDLACGPLLRATLMRRAQREHVLLVVMHHIIADGWSIAVLQGELAVAYNALARNATPELPPLPVQYGDYAEWQHGGLAADALSAQIAYWTAQLRDAPRLISLPTDRPRLPVQRHRGARLSREVPGPVLGALKRVARDADGTLFMVLLAAFATLLARYGGDEELCIGTPIAGRSRTELEGLIGFFVNTLVLRADLRGNPTFRELLARVRRTALEAYAQADVPLERLVEELRPARDPGRTPLFQVMFNLHNEPAQPLRLDGLEVARIGLGRQSAKFDLTVGVVEHDGGLNVTFEYNTDLFDAVTVEGLAGSYAQLLAEVSGDAGQRVGEVALLDECARAQVQREAARVGPGPAWGGRQARAAAEERWPEATLSERFAAQVARAPQRLAVSWAVAADVAQGAGEVAAGGSRLAPLLQSQPTPDQNPAGAAPAATRQQWSYAELDQHARAIAQRIMAATGTDTGPVALLLGHDGIMIAGLLGVLQAGRAYVPLDPWSPRARNARVLADAGAIAIVTDGGRLAAAPWLTDTGLPVVLADELVLHRQEPARVGSEPCRSGASRDSPPDPDEEAYLLYTSGTTGEPKGVVQTQRHVLGQVGQLDAAAGLISRRTG